MPPVVNFARWNALSCLPYATLVIGRDSGLSMTLLRPAPVSFSLDLCHLLQHRAVLGGGGARERAGQPSGGSPRQRNAPCCVQDPDGELQQGSKEGGRGEEEGRQGGEEAARRRRRRPQGGLAAGAQGARIERFRSRDSLLSWAISRARSCYRDVVVKIGNTLRAASSALRLSPHRSLAMHMPHLVAS